MAKAWCLVVALLALLVLAAPMAANAATLTQIQGFAGTPFDFIGVTPFDPTLGTLDKVEVHIFGTLSVTGIAPPLITVAPTPYAYQVQVSQTFSGLGSKYFDFLDPATFTFTGNALGVGEGFLLTTTFSYDFDFTAASDFVGFVFPSVSSTTAALIPPLSGIGGTRSDFVDNGFPLNEIDLLQTGLGLSFGGPVPIVQSVSSSGLMEIDYLFTPAAVNAPEPTPFLLLGAGLLVLGAYTAFRRGKR